MSCLLSKKVKQLQVSDHNATKLTNQPENKQLYLPAPPPTDSSSAFHVLCSARLFKHYHKRKEEAEEELNVVDPRPRNLALHPPHDIHINVISQHSAMRSRGHHKNRHQVLGLRPKVQCLF